MTVLFDTGNDGPGERYYGNEDMMELYEQGWRLPDINR
jgi:hypothetical protein